MKVSKTEQSPETEAEVPIEPAAKVLQLSHWGVRYRVKRGLLKAVRRRRKLFFEVSELLHALESKKKGAK